MWHLAIEARHQSQSHPDADEARFATRQTFGHLTRIASLGARWR
jgi:hypothetical protein